MIKLTNLQRFWLSFVLAIPLLVQMILMPFHLMMPAYNWIALVTTSLIMLISARAYWQSAWAAFRHHQANMNTLVAIGTAVAYFYSLFAMVTGREVYFESAAFVTVFVLLGDALEERMHNNATSALQKLASLQVKEALVLRNGHFVQVPLSAVHVGDVVQVKPGQQVPVDGIITAGTATIDESMVTGESMPVVKKAGDQVIGATVNQTTSFTFKATKVGQDTMLAQIVEMVKRAQTSHAPIQKLTDQLAGVFVPIVLIIAITIFIGWYVFAGSSPVTAMLFAVAVVVIACPCALGLATPTALMVGTARAAKMGVLIKDGEALEKINQVQTIIFDKTGTITNGKPIVTNILGDEENVLQLAASLEGQSEHPLGRAICEAAARRKISLLPVKNFKVVAGKGIRGDVDGQPTFVSSVESARETLSPSMIAKINQLQGEAKTITVIGRNEQAIGAIAIQDTPKPSAAPAIAALKQRGLTTVMLTGDNEDVARAIGKQVGIDEVIANVLPTEKAARIKKFQQKGKVAFVGDGINDAPALTIADVGIAMGTGTDIAIDAGDIVLVQNDLSGVVRALSISQKTFRRIKLNLFWAFIYNVIGIPVAAGLLAGLGVVLSPELAGLAMAFSSVSVVGSSLLLNKTKIAGEHLA